MFIPYFPLFSRVYTIVKNCLNFTYSASKKYFAWLVNNSNKPIPPTPLFAPLPPTPTRVFHTVRCLRSKSVQFARRLYESMKGLGTDDDTLVRTVVSRSEIDMVQIKAAFESAYKQTLGEYIKVEYIFIYM